MRISRESRTALRFCALGMQIYELLSLAQGYSRQHYDREIECGAKWPINGVHSEWSKELAESATRIINESAAPRHIENI
jgi:hypothetical protein